MMKASRLCRGRLAPRLLCLAACFISACVCRRFAASAFLRPALRRRPASAFSKTAGKFDFQAVEGMLQRPGAMEDLQAQLAQIMKDPKERKILEEYQARVGAAVKQMESDPEMQSLFDDVKANGFDAVRKFAKDPAAARRFSDIAEMLAPSTERNSHDAAVEGVDVISVGDEVVLQGLQGTWELNGQSAIVVPPTEDELAQLEATDRLVVTVMRSGDRIAVRPPNLRRLRGSAFSASEPAVS